jgi:hypothetical protein
MAGLIVDVHRMPGVARRGRDHASDEQRKHDARFDDGRPLERDCFHSGIHFATPKP